MNHDTIILIIAIAGIALATLGRLLFGGDEPVAEDPKPEPTRYVPPVEEREELKRIEEKLDASDKKIEASGAPSDAEFDDFVRRVLDDRGKR